MARILLLHPGPGLGLGLGSIVSGPRRRRVHKLLAALVCAGRLPVAGCRFVKHHVAVKGTRHWVRGDRDEGGGDGDGDGEQPLWSNLESSSMPLPAACCLAIVVRSAGDPESQQLKKNRAGG